jgi:hypothetical protein
MKGARERKLELEHKSTPIDLSIAMRHKVMQEFEPQLITGEDVLTRRAPPSRTTEQLTEDLAARFVGWLIAFLPRQVDPRSYEGEHFLGAVKETLFEWSYWRPEQGHPERAAEALSKSLIREFDEEVKRLRDIYEKRPPRDRLVPPTLSPEDALALARAFVDSFDAAKPEESMALVEALRARIDALGLTRQNEA